MNATTEIRWHARAGQGAKTAAQVLALALLQSGKSVQAFPEYGPERRGAPLKAFTRTSNTPDPSSRFRDRAGSGRRARAEPSARVRRCRRLAPRGNNSAERGSDAARARGHSGEMRARDATRRRARVELRERCHARRGRGVARRAVARVSRRCGGRTAGPQGVAGCRARRDQVGMAMAELSSWRDLPPGGRVSPVTAPRPHTGGWRTGVVAGSRARGLCQLPALLALLPGLGSEAGRHDVRRLRPRLLQGLRLCAEVCPTGAITMVEEPA